MKLDIMKNMGPAGYHGSSNLNLNETKTSIINGLKKLIIESNIQNTCDYFDMESLKDYLEFEKPLYSLISKRKTATLEYMSPKEYIMKIADGFGLSYEEALGNAYDVERANKYAEMMKNGSKAPIGYYSEGSSGQEGRHRAMAAEINGCEKIPVIKLTEVDKTEFYANKFKGYDYESLNSYFIKMGFPYGITKLGFNDLQRFIDYNL